MKLLSILAITCLFTLNVYSQNFKGKITDKIGEPIYGASIYIKEINQGLVCNEEGYYQTTLKTGNYQIEYKCLGFKTVNRKIQITNNETTTVDIVLEENPFTLSEVSISNREDPAYPIMRKAIEKAPLYAGSAKEYTTDAYIKMNVEFLKIPSFIDKMAKKEEGIKLSEFKEHLFVQESFNEIHFTAPDKYEQTVKAFSSSIPDNMDSKDVAGLISSSLYMPKVRMYISPLNPKSFSYYNFRYEGFFEVDGLTINKIKVNPKLKDPVLFDGYIYIADGTWHIYSAELNTDTYGVKQTLNISFQELGKNIYLPITYRIATDINILGMKATMNYYTSLTYKDIIINEDIARQLKDKETKKEKRQFEIPPRDSLYIRKSDTLATKRDSTYWKNIRVVPLEDRETVSYIKKDTFQHRLDSARKEHHDSKFSFGDLLGGGKIGGDSAKFTFKYNGLLMGTSYEYNFVDGLWMGQSFDIKTKTGKHNSIEASPYLYYATARKRMVGGGDINLSYAPMRLGKLNISLGSVSEDFNPDGIHRFNNYSNSLIKGKNYNYFYQKDFIKITNNIDISNGFTLMTGFEVDRRLGLSNNTDYTWGRKRDINPNIFSDDRFDRTVFGIGLQYTPYAYYTMNDGAKKYVKYTSPTFYTQYSHAFSSWQTNNARYHKLAGGIRQYIPLSEYTNLDYNIGGGGFLGNKDKIHFTDFHHFNAANVMVNFKSPFTSFILLDNYMASTNRYWVNAQVNYESKYLLLKYLPFLQGKMFTETIHLKSLYTPDMKLYSEAGYSVNLMRMLNFGTFASFRKGKYQDFGIRVSLDWNMIKRVSK
jgi:Outer membrane protein/protective antigen OMA87